MNPNSMIRYSADLFLASLVSFDARAFALPSPAHAQITMLMAADEDEEDEEDDDDDDLEEEDADDEDEEEDVEQTAEPDGQFPDAPGTLKDTERPGATQNRHGDRGGAS